MEHFLEIVGQVLFDSIFDDNTKEYDEVNNALGILKDSYSIVPWPDSQEYMIEEWFDKEAILEVEGKFGSSAYFIPNKYLIK